MLSGIGIRPPTPDKVLQLLAITLLHFLLRLLLLVVSLLELLTRNTGRRILDVLLLLLLELLPLRLCARVEVPLFGRLTLGLRLALSLGLPLGILALRLRSLPCLLLTLRFPG